MNNQDRLITEKEQLNDLVNSCQKEIRRLKEENQRLKKDIKIKEGLHETTFKNLMEARRENQRLEECCTDAYETGQEIIKDLEKENQRLNNVLNELERHLEQEILEWKDCSDEWTKAQVQEDKIILDKLVELKESDK